MSPPEPLLAAAVRTLRAGGLVAFPTETVYGLGADAENPAAVRRIFEAKGRPASHPLIVHLAAASELGRWAAVVSPLTEQLAARFWPGPLTLVVPRASRVPLAVTGGQDTVALRVPAHPLALELLAAFAGGLAAPSANRFGRVSPTCAEHVRADLGGAVDLVLDGGACEVGVESTIVDVSRGEPRLLRPGGVPREAIEQVLGQPLQVESAGPVRTPGQLPSHYAPRAEVVLSTSSELAARVSALRDRGARLGALAADDVPCPAGLIVRRAGLDAAAFARQLYAGLRELDAHELDVILVVAPPEHGLGAAVADRLQRASAPRPRD